MIRSNKYERFQAISDGGAAGAHPYTSNFHPSSGDIHLSIFGVRTFHCWLKSESKAVLDQTFGSGYVRGCVLTARQIGRAVASGVGASAREP